MKAAGINQLWAKLMVAELVRCGVSNFCVSPGSRSTPLVLAVADNPDAHVSVHFDERGSAFRALGYAKATGKPAVAICTSGTAVANYYPAVVEASQSNTPLIIISADRPSELRDTGAAQTINQVNIFGNYPRWQVDIAPPDTQVSPSYLLSTVDHAFRMAADGPVHLNCQFREPLAPLPDLHDFAVYLKPVANWLKGQTVCTEHAFASSQTDIQVARVTELAKSASRGVIVASNLPAHIDATPILELAALWQWPVVADVGSGLRTSGQKSANVICHADLYLRNERISELLKPDFVLQFGTAPISKHIAQFAASASEAYVVVNAGRARVDPYHRVTLRIECEPTQFAAGLLALSGVGPSELLDRFTKYDLLAQEALQKEVSGAPTDPISELQVASETARIVPTERGLFLATSMPIREFDCVASPIEQRMHVAANRGTNGIDGTIATAVGFADGLELPTTLLIGDLAMLHDLNSLALVRQSRQSITIVVLNNDGGGIFSMLPISESTSHFEEFFGTPHGLDFRNAAEMFGIKYHNPGTIKDFGTVYRHSLKSKKSSIIEVSCSRKENVRQHRQLWKVVQERIEKYVAK